MTDDSDRQAREEAKRLLPCDWMPDDADCVAGRVCPTCRARPAVAARIAELKRALAERERLVADIAREMEITTDSVFDGDESVDLYDGAGLTVGTAERIRRVLAGKGEHD